MCAQEAVLGGSPDQSPPLEGWRRTAAKTTAPEACIRCISGGECVCVGGVQPSMDNAYWYTYKRRSHAGVATFRNEQQRRSHMGLTPDTGSMPHS